MIIWLASYPRSGNTLLRTILWQSFGQTSYSKYNDVSDLGSSAETARAIGHQNYEGDWPAAYARFSAAKELCFVKTHEPPEDDRPAIYVVRHGYAAIVSNQHYWRDFAAREISIEDLISGKSGPYLSWGSHLDAWEPRNRPHTLFIKYEDLVENPAVQIAKIADCIGLKPTKEWRNDFAALQRLNPKFFRRGKTGIDRPELTASQIALFSAFHSDWLAALKYEAPATGRSDPAVCRYLRNAVHGEVAMETLKANALRELAATLAARETVIREQTNALQVITAECERLQREAAAARAEGKRAADEAQAHIDSLHLQVTKTAADNQRVIDALRVQLEQGTTEHQKHVDSLRAQLDRGTGESQKHIDSLRAQLDRGTGESQKHIDSLRAQLDQLAAASRQQTEYISVLERERDRLTSLTGQLNRDGAHYVEVIAEQNTYIKSLEARHPPAAP